MKYTKLAEDGGNLLVGDDAGGVHYWPKEFSRLTRELISPLSEPIRMPPFSGVYGPCHYPDLTSVDLTGGVDIAQAHGHADELETVTPKEYRLGHKSVWTAFTSFGWVVDEE